MAPCSRHESFNNDDEALLATGRALSRKLRARRLLLENIREPLQELPTKPDIFFEQAPNGLYPIVAFRTVPCDNYIKGYCHPCSYSARSYPSNLSGDEINRALLKQFDWLIDNFDAVCLQHADGNLKGYRLHNHLAKPSYMLQLAGMSSFFSDMEMPPLMRKTILERLVAFQERKNINLHVMLETRPEHLVTANDKGELSALSSLLQRLNAVVNMGFEAHDDFLRNVVFAKKLQLALFERAVSVAKQFCLDPGIFLFAGGFILTIAEILAEMRKNLAYLHDLSLFANVMVPNIQQYTLPDVLYEAGIYSLPEPYFLLDLLEILADFEPDRPNPVTPFNWFIGGLVADPAPRMTIMNHARRKTSERVTQAIENCLHEFIRGGNGNRLKRSITLLRKEADYQYHLEDLNKSNPLPWKIRLKNTMQIANDYFTVYDDNISNILSRSAT